MDGIKYWIEKEGTGHWFFVAFPVVLICLFIWFKGRKVRFLIPSLLISIVIINPLFYKKWNELGLYAYWRILWIVPVIPVISAVIPSLTEKIKKNWMKTLVVTVGVGLICFFGTYLYNGAGGSFVNATNAVKLPEDVIAIVERLFELDEQPRVIFQNPIGTYARQYSAEIEQLYGRDVNGYILWRSKDAWTINNLLNDSESELFTVSEYMANNDYDFLVLKDEGRQDRIADAGFELVDYVEGYGIYRGHGTATEIKKRNDLGQVISITTINENGEPINGEMGYATISYIYDKNGYVIREFRTDIDGIGVPDKNGYAGYEIEYDDHSHVLMERTIGTDANAIENNSGYAEVRRMYKGRNLVRESFYDANGKPVNRKDTKYAAVTMEYDSSNNVICERYFGANGEPVIASCGYASITREYDHQKLIREAYFDVDGNHIAITEGYSLKTYRYDTLGNCITESFIDEYGTLTNNIKGYALVEKEYDANNNIIIQRYLNANGQLVVTGSGYAEVHRQYEGNNVICEEYYDIDGKPLVQPAGHVAIEQTWENDRIISRTYLGIDGQPINRSDGYAKAVWTKEGNCFVTRLYDMDNTEVMIGNQNMVVDVRTGEDGWSDWFVPKYNITNSTQNIGYVNLGPKVEGDVYSCQIEVEFKGVSATEGENFRFGTQGARDGRWDVGNVWNNSLIHLGKVPDDGVYSYTTSVVISKDMVDISIFEIGFRCDYWASGMYRVRSVKVEKGVKSTEWTPGL